MPIEISEFEEKGTDPVRIGFSGEKTSKIKALLSENAGSAYSLEELAEHIDVDKGDKKALHNLTNLLYGVRRKGTVVMKVVDGVKYYAGVPAKE